MRRRVTVLSVTAVVLAAACTEINDSLTAPPPDAPAMAQAADQDIIPNEYIVVFRPDVADPAALAQSIAGLMGGTLRHTYTSALRGFAARFPDAALDALRSHPDVMLVEPDRLMYATGSGSQSPATWGIDRIDQRNLPLNNTYEWDTSGQGVRVYVLDTGIRYTHNEFGGRASFGTDVFGGDGSDCHGHGTHVSGTVGGSTYGVAKDVRLFSIRVLNCGGSGTTSGVIAGVDWVTANHVKPAVANMSLGGGASSSLDAAVRNSIAAGVTYTLAAGNANNNACFYSPARVTEGLTLGATTSSDVRSGFSNWGSCVDFFAPGSGITSAYYTSDNATAVFSGTSMAAPHTAGVAALFLEANPGATPPTVNAALFDATTKNIVSSSNSTNNHLLYSRVADGGPPANNPPVADFDADCTDLSCDFTDLSTDSDGTIVDWSWTFGDGASSTMQNPSHTYASGGTYTVMLTVTDDDGATDSHSQNVTVNEPGGGGITLTAFGSKDKGRHVIDLFWSGATSTNIDIYRDGSVIATTANDGSYTDATGNKGKATYQYVVCEAGTSTCSNTATVSY